MEQPLHTIETKALSPAELVRQLGSRHRAEREDAEKALRRLGPDAIEPLLVLMRDQERRLSRRSRLMRRISTFYVVCGLLMLILSLFMAAWRIPMPAWFSRRIFMVVWGVLLLVLNVVLMPVLTAETSVHRKAIQLLSDTNDLRIVGPLAELLPYLLVDARSPLMLLLPRLQATDTALLNAHQRQCLNKHLQAATRGGLQQLGDHEEFALAILKALEQVGDASALPYVTQAAKTARSSAVRQAAGDCLPYLTQRAESERAANSLLRASASTSVPDATLLRSAQCSPEPAPQQLLRAARPEDSVQKLSAGE